MALPDYEKWEFGTALVWVDSGGDYAMTLDGLANGSARMGPKHDFSTPFDGYCRVDLQIEFASAPTAGVACELFLPTSVGGSVWPAGVSGSDGAWPADGNEDEWAKQLGVPAMALIATNDAATQIQRESIIYLGGRFIAPVLDNNSGVAFASNQLSKITITPMRRLVQDTA